MPERDREACFDRIEEFGLPLLEWLSEWERFDGCGQRGGERCALGTLRIQQQAPHAGLRDALCEMRLPGRRARAPHFGVRGREGGFEGIDALSTSSLAQRAPMGVVRVDAAIQLCFANARLRRLGRAKASENTLACADHD